MLALYVASKGGTAFQARQDWLPQDASTVDPLQEGSVALAWRFIRARAEHIFTPPWKQFLRCSLGSHAVVFSLATAVASSIAHSAASAAGVEFAPVSCVVVPCWP